MSFYGEGLGLEPAAVWPADQGRALVLDMGKAMLEVFAVKKDPADSTGSSHLHSLLPVQLPCMRFAGMCII